MKYYIKIALQHFAMGLIIPVTIVWKLQNGLSLPEALLTESIVLLTTALADVPAGFIANRINNKRALLIGGLLHVVGIALLAVGSSLTVFIAAAVLSGLAWAFVSGADEAYIHDDYIDNQENYKKVFATASIVDEAATIIGMVGASALLYFHTAMRALFIIAAATMVVHLAYTYIFLPKSRQLRQSSDIGTGKPISRNLFRRQEFLALAPVMVAFAVVYEAGRTLWQPHMQQIGINIVNFGLIFAVLKLASIAGSLAARHHNLRIQGVLAIFALMLLSLLTFGTSIQAISIMALCVYLFTENYFRIYMSAVLNKAITRSRAAMLSVSSVIRNGTGALIVLCAGLFSETSIFAALLFIVIIKIPAIGYIAWWQTRSGISGKA